MSPTAVCVGVCLAVSYDDGFCVGFFVAIADVLEMEVVYICDYCAWLLPLLCLGALHQG